MLAGAAGCEQFLVLVLEFAILDVAQCCMQPARGYHQPCDAGTQVRGVCMRDACMAAAATTVHLQHTASSTAMAA